MAKIDFRALAQKATTLSELMTDRTKASTEDMVRNYPDGFTIDRFDIVSTGADTVFPVFTIREDDDIFYMGGAVLYKIVNTFIEAFDGDVDAASEMLHKDGGLKVKLITGRTKKGNSLTKVEII